MKGRGWTIPDVYRSKPCDLDECPECGGPKTKHGSVCIACRRRIGKARRPLQERFWEKVDQSGGQDSCWPWVGARTRLGYGRINLGGRGPTSTSSRVAYELSVGPIPEGLGILHRCDNPPCCNPAHLYPGTQRQNIHDAMSRGRHRKPPNRWKKVA